MKKLSFLLVTLLIGGVMLTGCTKEEEPITPEPTPTETTIVYSISNTYEGTQVYTLSPGLYFTFTYTDADGKEVKVENAELPWEKTITVTSPFEAKLEGEITYKEEELPEKVVFCKNIKIDPAMGSITQGSVINDFPQFVAQHPEEFKFSLSGKI